MSDRPAAWTGGTLPAGATSASAHRLAVAEGWVLETDVPRTIDRSRTWRWRAPEGEVSLVEDHRTGLRHMEARPAAFAERLAAALAWESAADLFERARTASGTLERMRAVHALGFLQYGAAIAAAATAPEDPDEPGYALLPDDVRYLEAFERALDDPEPSVCRAGVQGLAFGPWPGAREILRRRRAELPQFAGLIDERLNSAPPRFRRPATEDNTAS
ncbi:hypothetical protein [Actinoallomurus sp. CA-150999]|uniref:hypothetical protein n=1 Tax=Actinoallomurus sp. CA-150999 TaxID=3239887 RepID=UPI003D8ED766